MFPLVFFRNFFEIYFRSIGGITKNFIVKKLIIKEFYIKKESAVGAIIILRFFTLKTIKFVSDSQAWARRKCERFPIFVKLRMMVGLLKNNSFMSWLS